MRRSFLWNAYLLPNVPTVCVQYTDSTYLHNNNNLALSPFILRILTNCRYVYNSYPYAHNFFSISPTSSSSYLTPPLSVIIFQISSLSSHLAILSQLCFAASSFTKPRQSPSAAAAVHTQESSSCITPKFISPNPSCATQRELAGRYTSPQRLISSQNERRTIIYIYTYILPFALQRFHAPQFLRTLSPSELRSYNETSTSTLSVITSHCQQSKKSRTPLLWE